MQHTLYVARVDPHLTNGCEIGIDLSEGALKPLSDVQHTYWRRALGLNSRSARTPLYTETGIHPLRYRRVSLVLRFLLYLLRGGTELATVALNEALRLARSGAPSWISDLWHALDKLPVPVTFNFTNTLTVAYVTDTLEHVQTSLELFLQGNLRGKLTILNDRREWSQNGTLVQNILRFRDYLRIPIREHRLALTRLMCSDHPLAIEQGRRTVPSTPQQWRVCRFCGLRGSVESEAHVLMDCEHGILLQMREDFFAVAIAHVPSMLQQRRSLTSTQLLMAIISRFKLTAVFAQFVCRVFKLCDDVPWRAITSEAEFLALPVG